ncbi:hypothetical protein C8R34_1144 [Nitrosomonas sp. Nm84]|uniref:hypothetical protein n=1 Tax=Nitrosomonas sp. Nm84 TaxID=200124 RepID=UPI000D757919|nr:hypothetical protein [Nitrosomonas sp. Nm84]PXW86398.1 hypothetical protein C8R34_1144 [Nitrosomonas sp. Nm84]
MKKGIKIIIAAVLCIPVAANADWSITQLLDNSKYRASDSLAIDINDSGQILISSNETYLTGANGAGIKELGTDLFATHINDSGQIA